MFYSRFVQLCNLKGVSPSLVAKNLGYTATTVNRWKNGALPNSKIILDICDYFKVTSDYLLGLSDYPHSNLSANSQEMIDIYDKLDEQGKAIVKAEAIRELRRLEDR